MEIIQELILNKLQKSETVSSKDLQRELNLSEEAVYGKILKLLSNHYITFSITKNSKIILTQEGKKYQKQGTPQYQIYSMCSNQGTQKSEIEKKLGAVYQIGIGQGMKKKMVSLKDNLIYKSKQEFKDEERTLLTLIETGHANQVSEGSLKNLKKRNLVQEKSTNQYLIKRGPNYTAQKRFVVPELTSEMISKKNWKQFQFKKYNPQSMGSEIQSGNLHPLMKTKQVFAQTLLEMGFQEMNTNRYVESSFWNFDTLFQPQAHPARDAHDTFYLSEPKVSVVNDKQFFQATRQIHEKGGYGSLGYNYEWNPQEATKNILRTHTTAISSRYLKALSNQIKTKGFQPRKFYSIDRVFRNQAIDNTHLAQFHQVQGFIIDYKLGLPDLMGILTQFYNRIGIDKIWFKPTYNPYTQPSMEVFGYHPILKRKVQIGNSGIFRPEMLRPMGFPENISVIAWGLSLQRPTMIQQNISNIRQLFGSGVSLKSVKESAILCI